MPDYAALRPRFTCADAERIARDRYAVAAAAIELPSDRDRNFRLDVEGTPRFVLKIAHAGELTAALDLQDRALAHMASADPGLVVPRLVEDSAGHDRLVVPDGEGRRCAVRLFTWVDGRPLARVAPHSADLLASLGAVLGRIDRALATFDDEAADRDFPWDPRRAAWVPEAAACVSDPARRALLQRLFAWSGEALHTLAPGLPITVIHGDANDHNVLVTGGTPYDRRVSAIIDLGDMLRTWTVTDPAVAATYAMLDKPDPLAVAAHIVSGYHGVRPLAEAEIAAVLPLVVRRLCISLANAAQQHTFEPGNDYLFVTEEPGWQLLEHLAGVHPRFAAALFRAACGLEPSPAAPRVAAWLRAHAEALKPVLQPDPAGARRCIVDLSVVSADAGTPALWRDAARASRHVEALMARDQADVGIGRYDEVRACYTSPGFATPGLDGPEWRTVHLGLDLFVPPGTPVHAPLAGRVHSVHDNDGALDYGPTVILEHDAGAGNDGQPLAFWTLYGHLARASVAGLRAGQAVAAGEAFARVGAHTENGGWPPHLHLQLITDLLGKAGDYPGVARASDRAVWLSLSPDPNLVAGLPGVAPAPRYRPPEDLLATRRAHLGPSLSLSYRRPLTIVRGWMQHLVDADGRLYLDAVNNVPHVGHSHPRVVDAAQRQMAVLNTNTRYLHHLIGAYAERLCATLPAPLRVCFFVNSGSEANELALRLARAATGSRETVVLEVGYHGNTNAAVDLSSYKFDGPGGRGPAPWVHTVAIPDTYRAAWYRRNRRPDRSYAPTVADAVARLTFRGERPGALLAESILSCGGQVVLPDGYLKHAYAAVRAAGGVCIADEVQTGMGRVGTHMWAFETQGVTPDIVTMGKPIGNGHPLGAVVTTEEIARAFANGMEYFSTFGGNPVSCAVGLAVLDVVQNEGLQARASRVGAYLRERLVALQARHGLIGDVRGLGLFLGVELVRSRETLEPAGDEAGLIANRMRDRGVLMSTDGPFHNVLKIKPPMPFGEADADQLVDVFDLALREVAG